MSTDSTPENETTPNETENQGQPAAVEADTANAPSAVENTAPAAEPAATTENAPTDAPADATEAAAAEPRKIQIGSQRDSAGPVVSKPKAVSDAITNPVQLVEQAAAEEIEPVAIHSTAGLGEDVDAEIEAMMSEVSMDSIVAGVPEGVEELAEGTRVKGTVTRTHGDSVFFKLPSQFEGVASLSSFKTPPADGELVEVIIRELNSEDGLYEVGIPGAAVDVSAWEDLTEGETVEARVSGSNTGGLEVMVGSIRGFIPASQIDRVRVENFGDYVGQKMQCVVMEVKPRKKLVLSRRAILDREREVLRKEMLEKIEVGQTMEGTVTKLMDFGAFVDLGGIEGLIHISKLSWDRVKHPKEVIDVGERVKVKIENIDKQTGKMSLSHRDTLEDPWQSIDQKYVPNETVSGKVSRIMQFGAFVKLEPGVEGLVHISEIAHHRVVKVSNYVKEGDEVECKVLSVDPQSQKISLSIKATQAAPVKQEKQKDEPEEVAVRPLAVPKSSAPLKGGTDRKSGGEDFGLKW